MEIKIEENNLKNKKKYIFYMIFLVFFVIFSSFLLISCKKEKIDIKQLYISKSETTLFLGQSQKLYVNYLPEEANGFTILWKSSSPKTVSVDKLGYIRGLKYGSATITAYVKNSDVKAECQVTVNDGKVINVKIANNFKTYYEGQVFDKNDLKVYAIFQSGKEVLLSPNEFSVEMPETLYYDCEIKVTYQDFPTKSFFPYVKEDFVSAIELTSLPTKTDYIIGESFNPDGMQISLVYASGKKVLTEEYSFSEEILKFKQNEVKVKYDKFELAIPISTKAEITVDTIAKLQSAIDSGCKSIMVAEGSYNTTTQITLNAIQDVLIYGQTPTTSINGFNITPLKIKGSCGNITLADITLTTIGDTPQSHQIDLLSCESGNITLLNTSYTSILHAEKQSYTFNKKDG